MGEHALQARTGFIHQCFHGSRACLADGGEYPAAGCQDFQIFRPGHFHLELGGALSGPDDMGVRVHEAGQDGAAAGIEAGFVGISGQQVFGETDGQDRPIADEHGAIFEQAQAAQGMSALRAALQGEELGGGVDQHDSLDFTPVMI